MVGNYVKKLNFTVDGVKREIYGVAYVNDIAANKINEIIRLPAGTYTLSGVIDAINQLLEDDLRWSLFPVIYTGQGYFDNPGDDYILNQLFPSVSGQNVSLDVSPYTVIDFYDGDNFAFSIKTPGGQERNFQTSLLLTREEVFGPFLTSKGIRYKIPVFKSDDFIDGIIQVDNYLSGGNYNFNWIWIEIPFPNYINSEEFIVAIVTDEPLSPTSVGNIISYLKNTKLEEYVEDNDPFNPGGSSGTGGGGGSFDNTSTPIEIPPLPTISASDTGFISLYNPTLAQLNELAGYLWSDLFDIEGWRKLFANPMDSILGLSILPVPIPSGGGKEVKVGNIGTGISLTVAGSQFVEVDCGSINVNEYWGAYLDYEPYTQAQIFLPYIGTRPISVDEIMGKTVRVVYHVDILTGACCCFVKCGDSVLYTYNGQCSIPIPITGANYTSVVNGVISIAASVGSLVATGGASAPIAVPAIASSAVNQMKPQIEKSGSISGSAGVLNMQTPYLILIRPRQALPSKQNEFIGYPSLITVQLTELTGYTEVQSIHLENIPATQEELAEIQSLLEGGVIF